MAKYDETFSQVFVLFIFVRFVQNHNEKHCSFSFIYVGTCFKLSAQFWYMGTSTHSGGELWNISAETCTESLNILQVCNGIKMKRSNDEVLRC